MAYGYARATGKPSVCMTTSGPGTMNLLTGISLAYKGRAPVIAIAGDTALEYVGRDGSQAFDLVNIFKPVTKLAVQANKTTSVPRHIREAFRTALWGKQGPVLLDIPAICWTGPRFQTTSCSQMITVPLMSGCPVMRKRLRRPRICLRRLRDRCFLRAVVLSIRAHRMRPLRSPSFSTWLSFPRMGITMQCQTAIRTTSARREAGDQERRIRP